MASSRRKGASKAAATRRQWKIGDLVLAKVKGFPAWPATVSEPEKWGYSTDWKKVLVYFFGTQQIAFCNPADVEEFNEVKKESLLRKRCGKGAYFLRALNEIIDCYEKLKQQNQDFSANCNEETIESNGNSSAESLSESRTKDEAWVFTVKSPLKMPLSAEATSNLNFLTEAAVAAAAEDALHGERMRLEEAGDNLVATGMPMFTSYYTRSKAEVTLPRKGVGQWTFARRSRSSSRLDPNRLQNCMLLSSNNNRSSRYDSNNSLPVRSLRSSSRTVKSFDESDQYYTDPSVFVSNNSIEEEDSETVTVDSETLSFNQGSTVDSGCKPIQPESVAENHETETELSDRLDFQTNTGIVKRKRMPNRKRFSNDTAESEAKLDKVVFEADMHKAEHVLHSDDEKCAERYTKEDGDEHLPLVKRARVRMGRPSPAGEETGNSMHTEDKILDVYRGLSIQLSGSLNYKECNSAEQKSVFVEGDTFDLPLSNSSPVKKPQIWEARKNFVDGEATLPPSKRLHRALEAMSANVVEKSQKSLEYPSMVITSIDVCCSFGNCSEKAENLCNNDFGDESNPEISENNAKSFAAVADCIKPSCTVDISNSDSCNLSKPAESAERKESSLNEHSAEFNVSETNLKLESPNLDGKQTSVDCNNCSLDLFTRPTDGYKIECSVLAKTFGGHYPDIHVMCSDAALMEETTVGSLQNDTDMHIDSVDGKGDEASKSRHFSLAETNQDSRLSKIDKEAGPLLKDSNAIASATPSEVIIDAHHQHLSHSNSISDDCLEEKTVLVSHSSSPLTDGLDNRSLAKSNSLSIPDVQLHLDKAKRDDKLSTKGEADVALSSFEAILGSLTRTKETIVRATRIAIECAMFGFANKVVEILAHNLENEPRLHRKVDLFFLVDSITQCSRGMKGDGGIYPSAIQVLLPRLLLAAAPPSCSSHENHRQCLKVLRVWQERKILPEPIIRHHIRELDALCGSYSSWASSHRPLRNERAFDDPIREMEGMVVDEYGSNSSIQLTGFCMPPMLRVEDGGSDSDGENFEAVTPEHNTENIDGDKTLFPVVVKHSHVLKDVDGELEMEDVAPSCEAKVSSISNITDVDSAQTSHHQADNQFWAPFAPPRGGVQQTSLPRSAPPQPSRSHPPSRPFPPDSIFNGTKLKTYPSSQNVKYHSQESVMNHSVMSGGNPSSDIQSRASRELPDYTNSSSFRVRPVYHPPVQVSNSIQPSEVALNKSFHLHPPHPSPSNQFVYARDQQIQSRRDVAPPSHPNRFHTRNEENGNFYVSDRLKFPRRDSTGECWGPPLHSVSDCCSEYLSLGPCYPDGSRMPHAPISYTGPREAAFHNNRRDYLRPMNHRQFIPYRPPSEGPIPVENTGSNYWRPR